MARLRAGTQGGTIALDVPKAIQLQAEPIYRNALRRLDRFDYWRRGKKADYRPECGLWLPQRRAIAFLHAYLSVCRADPKMREAALVKMPTGTGKTAVIAALACTSPLVRKTLILTPRAGLVEQMKLDLSFRFWGERLGAVYHGGTLEEGLDEERIEALAKKIRRGAIAPVRELGADQYSRIWEERRLERQILVSTFNALHLILGLEPPPHRSMYGREARKVASSLEEIGLEEFRDLLMSVDLVIVDEGHYEPAYSWSQAVRKIDKPTIIFSATPYRNDYKYFKIAGKFVFNLPWQEAVEQGLIRPVQIERPIAPQPLEPRPDAMSPAPPGPYDERCFAREFAATLAALPKDRKAIVHAGTYRSLTRLQRAFMEVGTAAVLIHDAFTGAKLKCPDLKDLPRADRKALAALRFQHVHQTAGSVAAQDSKVWLHQYKLLEGIDDSRFVEVWLYDGFGSARQVVQQIGRAIRRPGDDPDGLRATIRASAKRLEFYEGAPTVREQTETRWKDYLAYERYVKDFVKVAFTAETQLLAGVKRAAPRVQYIAGEFRGGHFLDEEPTMEAFLLPRRAVVCRIRRRRGEPEVPISDELLDRLQADAMEAMYLEERFDFKQVVAPEGEAFRDARLIRYLAWGNSPYLARHHVPEWRLGVMAIVRAGRYIFLLDTEGICLDFARAGLVSPTSIEFKRLFPHEKKTPPAGIARTRIIATAAAGLDISELGLRSISVRRHALEEGYFDLAEASQVPTSVQGFSRLGADSARRRLSLSRSSVADASYGLLTVKNYVAWARLIAGSMADRRIRPHTYFDRFAREVQPLDEAAGKPQSILLDLWDLLDISDETRIQRRWDSKAIEKILSYDTCCDVVRRLDRKSGRATYQFKFGKYKMELKYFHRNTVPPAGRYMIVGEPLNAAVAEAVDPNNLALGERLPVSLTRLINQEQAFRIVPKARGIVYSHGHFYAPTIDRAMLSILEPVAAMGKVVSEKGDTRLADADDWGHATLFGLVDGWLGGAAYAPTNKFAADLMACQTVICDDRGAETADFYGIDELGKRVLIIHAKADPGRPGASARKLQDVTRQAQASLAFAGSSRRGFPLPAQWSKPWSVVLTAAGGAKITRPRLLRGRDRTMAAAHGQLLRALADPSYAKHVIMLTSGLLSSKAAYRAQRGTGQRDLQFLYFLASVRSSFDRAGIRFRIICDP